ncbi:MAG: hypothetical protein LAN62_01010 [Acidobacteriia bacterium]|nr:hypothetical protein [Terriglobia bacterium]
MASSIFPLTFDVQEIRPEARTSAIVPRGTAPLSAEALNSFHEGMELLGLGRPGEAIGRLESAVARAPEYADGFVGLGMAYAMDSRVYPALDSFEKAAELDPANFFAHFKLAQFCFKLRIPKKGYEEAELALRCATSLEERRLVAQILKEERQREAGGVKRPTWNKPFSRIWTRVGFGLLLAACLILVLHVR